MNTDTFFKFYYELLAIFFIACKGKCQKIQISFKIHFYDLKTYFKITQTVKNHKIMT